MLMYYATNKTPHPTATGAADGSTTLFEICSGLAVIQPNEKPSISQMLEREAKREKNLETRARELRLAAKKAEQMQAKEKRGDDEEVYTDMAIIHYSYVLMK